MTPAARTRLRFDEEARAAETNVNLSAVREDGSFLWVAGDETATVERLTRDETTGDYSAHRSFRLDDFVELPTDGDEEADIEGIGRAGGYLWITGSHSRKRKKVKDKHSDDKAMSRLATVTDERNRHVIARLPVSYEDGVPMLRGEQGQRSAAILGGAGGRSLTDELVGDAHLGPFVPIPSKDNGLDIEGIAAHGDRLYLGLRGPVLRGWAVVLEIEPYATAHEPNRLRLAEIDGELYRKHFLDLDGLGIRDLCPQGEDLLVLAGPTMDLDGPMRVYRWPGAALADDAGLARADELTPLLDLPSGNGDDHAEGIALVERPGENDHLLVVYDSPAESRRTDQGIVADVFTL